MGALADLKMGAGAGAGLEEYFTRVLLERQQREHERATRVQEARQAEQLAQNDAYRRDVLASNADTRKAQEADRQEAQKIRRINIALSAAPGSEIQAPEYDYNTKELGIPASFYDKGSKAGFVDQQTGQAGAEGPVEVPQIRFLGKASDQAKADADQRARDIAQMNIDARAEQGNQQREMMKYIAQLNASTKAKNTGPGKIVQWQDENGVNWTGEWASDGTILHAERSQLGAGAKKDQTDNMTLLNQIDDITTLGDNIGWKGVGSTFTGAGSAREMAYQTFGVGDPNQASLRTSISTMVADIAHGKYGSALTPTETKRLAEFAPSIDLAPEAIKTKLAVMRRNIEHRLAQLSQGLRPESADPLDLRDDPSAGAQFGQPQMNQYGQQQITPGVRPAGGRGQYGQAGAMRGVQVPQGVDPNDPMGILK